MSNFLNNLQRDLKKVDVEPKHILKKRQSDIENEKEKALEIKKSNEKIWRDMKM